jgi:hypothetical protein
LELELKVPQELLFLLLRDKRRRLVDPNAQVVLPASNLTVQLLIVNLLVDRLRVGEVVCQWVLHELLNEMLVIIEDSLGEFESHGLLPYQCGHLVSLRLEYADELHGVVQASQYQRDRYVSQENRQLNRLDYLLPLGKKKRLILLMDPFLQFERVEVIGHSLHEIK